MRRPQAGVNARAGSAHSSVITGAAYVYPSEIVNNDDFFERAHFPVTEDPGRLIEETQMKTRTWCAPGENPWTMARQAVDTLVSERPALAEEIDLVLVASGTTMPLAHPPEPESPGMGDLAPLVLRHLGRTDALGLDIKACYCTGFLRGLQLADGLLANRNYRSALIIATEHGSRFAVADSNRSKFCFISSDAAGAVVLTRRGPLERAGLVDHFGFTEADKLSWVGIGDDAASMVMRGQRAGEATRRMLLRCATALLERNHLSSEDVDWLLPIQTHAGIIQSLRAALGFPEEKLIWRGDVTGFAGSASIPAALAHQLQAGRIRRGDLVLSVAVGAGMNCGGTLFYV